MSKPMTKQEVQEELLETYADDIDDNDYVFVLTETGELKTLFLPDDLPFEAPKNVQKILKMFKISDIDNLGKDATLH
jgi:hypothetical protein